MAASGSQSVWNTPIWFTITENREGQLSHGRVICISTSLCDLIELFQFYINLKSLLHHLFYLHSALLCGNTCIKGVTWTTLFSQITVCTLFPSSGYRKSSSTGPQDLERGTAAARCLDASFRSGSKSQSAQNVRAEGKLNLWPQLSPVQQQTLNAVIAHPHPHQVTPHGTASTLQWSLCVQPTVTHRFPDASVGESAG